MQLCPCAVSECNKADILIDVQMCGFDCAQSNEQDMQDTYRTENERGKKMFYQKSFTQIYRVSCSLKIKENFLPKLFIENDCFIMHAAEHVAPIQLRYADEQIVIVLAFSSAFPWLLMCR